MGVILLRFSCHPLPCHLCESLLSLLTGPWWVHGWHFPQCQELQLARVWWFSQCWLQSPVWSDWSSCTGKNCSWRLFYYCAGLTPGWQGVCFDCVWKMCTCNISATWPDQWSADIPRLPIWWEYQTPTVQQVRRAWWTPPSLPGLISLFRWPARTWWTQPAPNLRYMLTSQQSH